jgi:hypothetical protein
MDRRRKDGAALVYRRATNSAASLALTSAAPAQPTKAQAEPAKRSPAHYL